MPRRGNGMNHTTLKPFRVFHLGCFIQDELDERGWDQSVLADVLGITPQHVSELLAGEVSITADVAVRLSQTFKQSALYWLNLQEA